MQASTQKKLFDYGKELGKIIMDGVLSVVEKSEKEDSQSAYNERGEKQ